ncbi:ferrichrome-iron receptor [Pseudomonas syringae pv. actinidiae ICMP 18804]|uniref:Ferrichrome-iron receptor n=4 Tax=Pseudomonas syringae TaxID=317 RepID=A0A3M4KJG4_PSESF|nr:ferrichrome-iron receptor [Pseudomonas syringae pv. actinidiae ICMP 19098]EPN06869.1 ferrichrome-iron receptor [Pseudomonas syringae pv. actinidiae ICMP 18804]EPN19703.1 ferrichrome-iron receptor [Pseudomonas syringae pv. actinidiae ICMP 19100]EPN23071.1 ferrichrome-iron receptor [Pseudomonas syringae pv. actinidiae ICMP 19099]EPN35510.1 ferrichrome-iron receptor [Pseudomonas syringae pv. actinidiae ICMP 18883]EPN38837.1 ferrichrome-iron receptor [Pseudomonas syringae pv. actinidiae ICMP 19
MTKHEAGPGAPSRTLAQHPLLEASTSLTSHNQRPALMLGLCSVTAIVWALNASPARAEALQIDAVNIDADTAPAVPTEADNVEASRTSYQARRASVATRTDARLVETPQSVNVVTNRVIEDRAPASLDEAINAVSGVKQGNTLGGTQDAIQKRGFGTNRDNSIMRDGMQSVQARNFTPTTERIEVLKGPASMLYGVQDPGGIINVVTKKPQLTSAHSISAFGTSFGGGGEQIDSTGPLGDSGLAYRFIADKQNYDYWRNFGSIDQSVIAPSLAWYGDDTTVSAAYEHMEYSVPFDRGTQINPRTGKVLDIPRNRRLDEPFNVTTGRSDALDLRMEHRFNDTWSIRTGYGYSRNYYNDYQSRYMSANYTTGVVTRRGDATRDAVQVAHTATVNTLGKLYWGDTLHEVLIGADYMKNERDLGDLIRNTQRADFNYNSPVYGNAALPSTVSAANSDQSDHLRTHAFFVQDSIHLGEKWILQGGLRYDAFDEITGKGRPFVVGADVKDSKVVPRVGLVYMLRPDWSLYTSYTESFRPNTSIATPIGDLPPEEGKAYEFGTKFENDSITATVALFNINKKNVQTSETCGTETCTRVSGEVRSRGLEADVTGKINEYWSVTGSYAYTDTEVLKDPILEGQPLDGVSKHTAALYLTRDFGHVGIGDLRAGAGARYASRWGVNDGTGVEYYLPSSKVADAFVSYKMKFENRDITLQLNLKNMFDERYYVSSSGLGSPAIVIGEPRQLIGRVKLDF